MLAFVWPAPVLVLVLVWVFYENIRAVQESRRGDKDVDRDILYIRGAVSGLSLYWLGANVLRWIGHLSPVAYLDLVGPLSLVVFIVVWGLPARLYRRRRESARQALNVELAAARQIAETVKKDLE